MEVSAFMESVTYCKNINVFQYLVEIFGQELYVSINDIYA